MDDNTKQPPEFDTEELVMPEGSQAHPDAAHHNRVGIVLGLLIVLLVLILGGMYVWYETAFTTPVQPMPEERVVPDMPNEPEMQNADAAVQQLQAVSTSNEIGAIEADIEATNLDSLDAELNSIDAELDAALEAF